MSSLASHPGVRIATMLRAVIGLIALAAAPAFAVDVPYLSGRVVDEAEILSPATRERVSTLSRTHEERSGDQVAVLTVRTLDGESVEDYAVRVFEAWKLGQKGKDNGVLVVVVPDDRKMRIEVGYGLEGTLPDAIAARIIRNRMTPKFKNGDYDGGVLDGVTAIVAQLEGQATEPAGGGTGTTSTKPSAFAGFDEQLPPWPMRILLGAFIFGIIGLFTFIGIATPGMGWFLYVFLIPFWAMFPIIVLGVRGALVLLCTYVVGFPLAKLWASRQAWYEKAAKEMKAKGSASIGGFTIGGGGSSWSSSSGSSSGGFSGGGGSSGGGGASGSW